MNVLKDFRAWRKHEFHGNIEDMINKVERILEKAEKNSCEGCKYSGDASFNGMKVCTECCNNYYNKWMPKPKKTRQSEFLKLFPNARLIDGALAVSPCVVDKSLYAGKDEHGNCVRCIEFKQGCRGCADAYWNEEVE